MKRGFRDRFFERVGKSLRSKFIRLLPAGPTRADEERPAKVQFSDSAGYWEQRYARGGDSGDGSYGKLAAFKSEVINEFVRKHAIRSIVEFGAGDGNQLSMLDLPRYVGLDVSSTAIESLKKNFSSDTAKEFWLCMDGVPDAVRNDSFDLAISLDVIFHLIEDAVFEQYMRDLFAASNRFVLIYASNHDAADVARHVKHRRFTDLVTREFNDWELLELIENPHKPRSPSDFFIYERHEAGGPTPNPA